MARAYIDFKVNLPDTTGDIIDPQLEYIDFYNSKRGISIRIDCNGESDWKISDQQFSCRWKDLETRIEVDGEDSDEEWNDFSKDDYDLIKDMKVTEIGIYTGDVGFENPLHIEDISLSIVLDDDEIKFHEDTVNLDVFGEEGEKEQIENPA
ncbi:MAG: hypothetical protein J6N70_00495 [Oribacterium sp.]|nr:hypothetical protein [Oribacterium sp.]